MGDFKLQLKSGADYFYNIRKSKKARRPNISMRSNGQMTVTIPWYRTELTAIRLVNEKKDWIERRVKENQNSCKISFIPHDEKEKRKIVRDARKKIKERIDFFNHYYGFRYNRVSIKDTHSQWGSCSSKRNLNFNYRLAFLPAELCDYIVVHELCHLKEMNHSKDFWNLVGETIPDHLSKRRWLLRYVI